MSRQDIFSIELKSFFIKIIIVDGPLGKVKYNAIRVECQVRGSPHVHSFLWVIGAPVLTKETKEEYIYIFVDQVIKASLTNLSDSPKLYDLVRTYQLHSHSKSCRKYEAVLSKVMNYIDLNLNPKNVNIIDPRKENYVSPKSIPEIPQELLLTEQEYYNALAISTDNDFQVLMKRFPNSCFIDNYFADGLRAWEANLDIQPAFNHYKAVSYMCAYFSKSEDESSEAMKQAAKEAIKMNLSSYEQMKLIARSYIRHYFKSPNWCRMDS